MALFALVKNNVVENIIVADQNFIDSIIKSKYDFCIEYTETDNVGIGYTYDNETETFTQ